MLRLYVIVAMTITTPLVRLSTICETKRKKERLSEAGAVELTTIIITAGLAALAIAVVAAIGVVVKKYIGRL